MPGVSAGDIGPKYGTHSNDNGYLRLDRVRIPRNQMLMRFSQVSREGRYSTPPHAKLAYGTMVVVRATIVAAAASALAASTTIAVRYAVVRTQGYKVRHMGVRGHRRGCSDGRATSRACPSAGVQSAAPVGGARLGLAAKRFW